MKTSLVIKANGPRKGATPLLGSNLRTQPKELVLAEAALEYAKKAREASPCERAKHACVLTDTDFNIISVGYNGPPSGFPNHCERPQEVGNCGCIHAEINALIKPHRVIGPRYAFITSHPCESCARTLVNARIAKVFYTGPGHRSYATGLEILDRANIPHGTPGDLL